MIAAFEYSVSLRSPRGVVASERAVEGEHDRLADEVDDDEVGPRQRAAGDDQGDGQDHAERARPG